MLERNQIYCMDAFELMAQLPDGSVDCVVTSPPYYGLRDYGVDGQIGLEQTPREYVDKLVAVFREVRRVLKPMGTCWLNIGDSYAGSGKGGNPDDSEWSGFAGNKDREKSAQTNTKVIPGFKPKDLMMIPARVAIALQDDGWYLRSEIVWHKANPMPESVKDRPTKAHEMVYLLTKARSYWYDADAIREKATYGENRATFRGGGTYTNNRSFNNSIGVETDGETRDRPEIGDRNARSVWTIPTEPTPFAHFATFPQKLVERCIRAGCPAQVCAACGKPYERVVEVEYQHINYTKPRDMSSYVASKSGQVANRITTTLGFRPTCTCATTDTVPGIVLDPFGGSGTTGLVARELGRRFVMCDLSPEYVEIANKRLALPYNVPLPGLE